MAGRKIFVGSLPDGVQESVLRAEFSPYGQVEDVYVKAGCEPGRQWAFITFQTAQQANDAKDGTDRVLKLVGAERPVEVMLARNQGRFGQPAENSSPAPAPAASPAGGSNSVPKKIFIGSLPESITETGLREEFAKYGQIVDLFLKTNCERGKNWAFISYSTSEEANLAKCSTDRVLVFPGSDRACEVMLARNQGINGQEPLHSAAAASSGHVATMTAAHAASQGPMKIFVGSLPDTVTETLIRAEFSKYGQITDVYLKTGCEPGKQWAFINFATHAQAQHAKDATDRVLILPGATGPCETMFAKNQGRGGHDAFSSSAAGGVPGQVGALQAYPGGQPPPPSTPMPAHLNPWRVYYTSTGLPYYYNHASGQTQWECPPEFQPFTAAASMPAMAGIPTMAAAPGQDSGVYAAMAQAQAQAQQVAVYYGAMYNPAAAAGQARYAPF
eukprot:TRINITY_DN27427_c0_g1_i1.p1 TRINITY_DN27427_c0_g1~~TRINITY_DN27427_c0_g1_i1.p1  ORF type:complete len:474 (+),score=69.00 TRINITY_DN27427_c0_g1_i1:92-1423(+)